MPARPTEARLTRQESALTFEEAHARHLARLDAAFAQVRAVHADPAFCNQAAKDNETAHAELKHAEAALWRLKDAWNEARE